MNQSFDMVSIDLTSVNDLMLEASAVMARVRRAQVAPAAGDANAKNAAEKRLASNSATVSRDLLYLGHVLRRASCEVEAQYFAARGYIDALVP